MKKKVVIPGLIVLLTLLITSGCTEIFIGDNGSITYQSHPTKIMYSISYGYNISCRGTGDYIIKYDCDIPEVLKGDVISIIVHDNNYEEKIIATFNTIKSWNLTGSNSKDYNLGLTAMVEAESFLIADLNGLNALTIQEINNQYPTLVNQYCQAQSNETTIFINPNNPDIIAIANGISTNAQTNNSFIVAKEIFKWLKQQTTYQIHIIDNSVQPAEVTLQYKTGDCDDLSFLYISLCRAINIPSRFIRGFLVEENIVIPHAWVEVFVGGSIGDNGWIPVECAGVADKIETEVNQNFGVESAEHLRIYKDDGSNESLIVSLSDFYSQYIQGMVIEAQSYSQISNYLIIRFNELVIDKNGNRYYQ